MTSTPASWTSQSKATPVASRTRRVASDSSGPTPSPGMKVTLCAIRSPDSKGDHYPRACTAEPTEAPAPEGPRYAALPALRVLCREVTAEGVERAAVDGVVRPRLEHHSFAVEDDAPRVEEDLSCARNRVGSAESSLNSLAARVIRDVDGREVGGQRLLIRCCRFSVSRVVVGQDVLDDVPLVVVVRRDLEAAVLR